MPVTAKLSDAFYERLGNQVATEMVDWFNATDAHYRDELRYHNELNFQRFDARVEQRLEVVRGLLDARITRVESELTAKIDAVGARLDAKIDAVGARLDAKIDAIEARLDAKIDRVAAELNARIEARFADLLKWSFVFWITNLISFAALLRWMR